MLGTKEHSAVGRKFLAKLLKCKKTNEFEMFEWEERQAPVGQQAVRCVVCWFVLAGPQRKRRWIRKSEKSSRRETRRA